MAQIESQVNPNQWAILRRELVVRHRRPRGQPAFVFYFFTIIVFAGALGFIIPAIQIGVILALGRTPTIDQQLSVPNGMATYLIAMIASVGAELALNDKPRSRAFIMLAFLVSMIAGLFGILCIIFSAIFPKTGLAFGLAVPPYLLALWLWWILNADNTLFQEKPNAEAAIGGSAEQNLSGSLEGIDA